MSFSDEKLKISQLLYQTVLNTLQDGFVMLDKQLNVLQANNKIEAWYPEKKPFVGKKCYELFHESNVACENCPSLKAIKTGEPHKHIISNTEFKSAPEWMALTAAPVKDASGTIISVVKYVSDITETKKLQDALLECKNQLKELEPKDPLTGADSRKRFLEKADDAFARAHRYNRPLSVFMVDIDLFREINKDHGQVVGNSVIRMIAKSCANFLRGTDLFGRIGGEEFAVVLDETPKEMAVDVAERLRQKISEEYVVSASKKIAFTVSIGVSVYHKDDLSFEDILRRADFALDEAKEKGRNCVVMA